MTGFEPATPGTTNQCSNQLSYNHRINVGFVYMDPKNSTMRPKADANLQFLQILEID